MKILFASDMSFNYISEKPSAEKAQKTMCNTAKLFAKTDFSVLNLENIFGDKSTGIPIVKSGPNLISDDGFCEYINILKPTGVGLANNHAGDFGKEPLMHTIALLKKQGYQCAGAGGNIDEAYLPMIFEKDNIKTAVFAVCENEFGIADDNQAGAAGYNLSRVTKAIRTALKEEFIPIIYFHGGNEFNPFPSPGKIELYRHFIDIGAKAVIAMHTHCPQGYEIYNDAPIVYSMGNFFFPTTKDKAKSWYYGYMTELDISDNGIDMEIIPYKFDFESHTVLEGNEKEWFMEYIKYISKPINDTSAIKQYFDSWCIIAGLGGYINHLEMPSEILNAKPSEINDIRNIFTCEAHNELIKNTIKIIFDKKIQEAYKYVDDIKMLQEMNMSDIIL